MISKALIFFLCNYIKLLSFLSRDAKLAGYKWNIQADIDSSGTIDYGEFIVATMYLNKVEREDNLFAAFSYFDKDSSRYITKIAGLNMFRGSCVVILGVWTRLKSVFTSKLSTAVTLLFSLHVSLDNKLH